MYKKIMLPLDGSELAECVLPHVEAIATACKAASVVFVRVLHPIHLQANVPANGILGFNEKKLKQMEEQRRQAADDYLKKIVESCRINEAALSCEVLKGSVATTLSQWAENNRVDLIVIASHGRSGISRWVYGSVADRVLRSACTPILMIRAPGCKSGI